MTAHNDVIGTIRASSWSTLMDCSYRWYWKHIVGLRRASSGAAWLGTSLHRSTGAYDSGRLAGGEALSVDETAGVFVDALNNPDEDVDWSETNPRAAEKIGLALHTRYCRDIAPMREYEAVELKCEALDVATEAGVVRLTGTTDRVRKSARGHGISDLKSGARSVGADGRAATQGHSLQLGVYTLLAENATGWAMDAAAEIIGLQTNRAARVGTGEVADVKTPLLGTEETPGLIEIAAEMLKAGLFPPNPKSALCSARYCAAYSRCKYHG